MNLYLVTEGKATACGIGNVTYQGQTIAAATGYAP